MDFWFIVFLAAVVIVCIIGFVLGFAVPDIGQTEARLVEMEMEKRRRKREEEESRCETELEKEMEKGV